MIGSLLFLTDHSVRRSSGARRRGLVPPLSEGLGYSWLPIGAEATISSPSRDSTTGRTCADPAPTLPSSRIDSSTSGTGALCCATCREHRPAPGIVAPSSVPGVSGAGPGRTPVVRTCVSCSAPASGSDVPGVTSTGKTVSSSSNSTTSSSPTGARKKQGSVYAASPSESIGWSGGHVCLFPRAARQASSVSRHRPSQGSK